MELWVFWAAVALLVAGVVATLWRAVWRARAETRVAADFDLAVYRDQLTEIERDIARGTIPADEGVRLRTEIQRRLLDADRNAQKAAPAAEARAGWGLAVLIAVAMGAGVYGYWRLGAPGYPDLPLEARFAMAEEARANRPSQADAEAQIPPGLPRSDIDPSFLDLMDKLRQAVQDRPDDLRGFELLARNEAAMGNLAAAKDAQAAMLRIKGDAATAEDHAAHAELMIMAAGGFVSPEAEQALVRALALDPADGTARYYTGIMFAQIGRFDRTFILWRRLLEESPPDAPWVQSIRAQLPQVAERAGVRYTLPAAASAPGPTAGDIAAAAEMSAEDRQAMIEGMVDQLGARLATDGGPAEDWARLITSLAQIGRTEQAREIYAEAQTRFAGRTVELSGLREAAVMAGVAE
ncbi:MAG: c-type cytochrome biogenesis protein CcmI [Pseudotabrizicola sp.]|uniref:c-type cytochrome biogenesis protein CcmI n=1 Tax=Pseudotabrizicola sp. TaxID=2939647 RepID=UPI00273028B0|nr:c-type cytochrome biogenesis protein CcmI [Pseudotabrizicola sp.]MDP2079829.1 c-type cytochrome biogenesis protein CcmI [Pseudotabrizicola sp.]MDZ7574830.1 c-type cytochrome biogenesis protein CcmI [Pseudotabrizicola sp.]